MAKKDDRILNRFTIKEVLSTGAFTSTYLADDSEGSAVTILEIPIAALDSWDIVSQYEKRAEQYRELSGASLPGFIGYYSDESGESPATYFVQEHVEGTPLGKIIEDDGPLGAEEVTRMLKDLLNGLSLLHRLSPPAVCGRIPPDTIIRSDSGAYRLAALPVPAFKPEQPSGPAGKPSDIYSLGISALFALTGIDPVHAPDLAPGQRNRFLESEYATTGLGRILTMMIGPDIATRSPDAGKLLSRLSAIEEVPAGKTRRAPGPLGAPGPPEGPAGAPDSSVEIVSSASQDRITVYNPDASRPENMLIGVVLDLWASKPWLLILIAAVLSAGPVAIALLIFLLHPKSRNLLNRAYAKIRDVSLTLGRRSLVVSDQLKGVEYTDVLSYDIREISHASGIQLETVLRMRNNKEIRFYLSSLNQEDSRRVRKLIDARFPCRENDRERKAPDA
ncbi:MAG: hypothetical protein JW852_10120 [Spirochaetales bacterium]|nr:hypothetical protein [Spirochaetales bacterium]